MGTTRTQRKKENGIAFLTTDRHKSDEDILKLQLRLSKNLREVSVMNSTSKQK